MALNDDAVKAAAEAILARGRNWQVNGYMSESLAEAAVAAAAPILLAGERARIAAAIRAEAARRTARIISPYDRAHRDGLLSAARIAETAPDVPMSPNKRHAETAPEGDPPCPTCGHPMTVHDVSEGWICNRHPLIAETAPEEGP